jgi:DNA-directed RNA polymerase specialized sigma subunit
MRCEMVLNNIEKDVKIKCVEEETTQQVLAEKVGTSGQYVSRLIKKKDGIINKTFVELMDQLGYDIELTYVKKTE